MRRLWWMAVVLGVGAAACGDDAAGRGGGSSDDLGAPGDVTGAGQADGAVDIATPADATPDGGPVGGSKDGGGDDATPADDAGGGGTPDATVSDAAADAGDATSPDAADSASLPDAVADTQVDDTGAGDAGAATDAADGAAAGGDVGDTAGPDDATTLQDTLADGTGGDAGEPGPDAEDAGGAAADAAADTADADTTPFAYAWEPDGPCGAAPYSWLPPSEVGALIAWEPMPLYSQTPDTIQYLLQELGYPGELPIDYATKAWRIRYLTQDRGQLVEATAMVGVPDHTASADPVTVDTVLFMHPTVGYADKCAPSDGLYGGAAAVLPASLGYISVAPDLLGLCGAAEPCGGFHPYLIGEPTAVAALDAVRAAEELLPLVAADTHVTPSHRVVPWGGSQGGHAALFVDRYAPLYAPEIEIPCVVAIVPPADLAGQAAVALGTLDGSTSLGTAFLAAALLWYDPAGGAAAVFNTAGTVDFAQQVMSIFPTTCSDSALIAGATSVQDLFAPDFLEAMTSGGQTADTPWGCIALDNSLPTTSVPLLTNSEILFVLGSADEIVDHTTELGSFESMCAQGYRMELIDCAGSSHVDTAVDSLPAQVDWVAACLAGASIPDEISCVVTPPVSCKK